MTEKLSENHCSSAGPYFQERYQKIYISNPDGKGLYKAPLAKKSYENDLNFFSKMKLNYFSMRNHDMISAWSVFPEK